MRNTLTAAAARGGHWPRALATTLLLLTGLGCGASVEPYEPVTGDEAASRFWSLTVDHQAVTLSTLAGYDTLRLTATPRDQHGAPLVGLGPVSFRSVVPQVISVSPDGLLQALGTGTSMAVIAELQVGELRHADTVVVSITADATPPSVTAFSIQPTPPDSAVLPMTGDGSLLQIDAHGDLHPTAIRFAFATILDGAGQPTFSVATDVRSSDTTIAQSLSDGSLFVVYPVRPGQVTIAASATAYGQRFTDTLALTVTLPSWTAVSIKPLVPAPGEAPVPAFLPSEVTVLPGGSVIWLNLANAPIDVVFDDPAAALDNAPVNCTKTGGPEAGGSGNLEAFGVPLDLLASQLDPANCRSRRFDTPGTYSYHSTLTGATGRIVVSSGTTP